MAYVSTTSGSWDFGDTEAGYANPSILLPVSVNAGDVLVAVTHATRINGYVASPSLNWLGVPTGWTKTGLWYVTAGGHPNDARRVVLVAWTRVSATGTENVALSWLGWRDEYDMRTHVLRFSGMHALHGHAAIRRAGQNWSFPAVSGAVAGNSHAIRISVIDTDAPGQAIPAPGSHTQRVDAPYSTYRAMRTQIFTQDLSSAAPAATTPVSQNPDGWAITLYVGPPSAPGAPWIVGPLGDAHDLTQPWTLEWTPDGTQDKVRVTRQTIDGNGDPVGSLQYLTSIGSPAWSSSPTTLTSSATSVDFPSAMFSASGTRYKITVATHKPDTALGAAAQKTILSWQGPTATAVTGGEVGGVIPTRSPWITVTGTPGSGTSLDAAQVEVVDATAGEVYAAGEYGYGWWFPVPETDEGALPNGAVVKLRGRVRQLGSQWSDWVEAGPFTVDAPRPAAPTISVAPVTHSTSGVPGLAVTINSIAGTVALSRDGSPLGEWTTDGTLVVQDYAAPTDAQVTYSAIVVDAGPPREESLPATANATLTAGSEDHCWLIDPQHPETAVQAHCVTITEPIGHPGTVFRPIAATGTVAAIVQSLQPWTPEGTLTVSTDTRAQEEAVVTMLTSGRPLIYRRWVETSPSGDTAPLGDLRFVPHGTVTPERPADGPSSWRHITVAWVTA